MQQPEQAGGAAAGQPSAATPGAASMALGFAKFEQHTRGVGSRLMARMGWMEGMGLGAQKHGRAEPVQALRRPKNVGLGAGQIT